MKPIAFTRHATLQMLERGASAEEVVDSVRSGEEVPAKRGRRGFRRNFQYDSDWGGRRYAVKQIPAIVADEPDHMVIVTVYAFFF